MELNILTRVESHAVDLFRLDANKLNEPTKQLNDKQLDHKTSPESLTELSEINILNPRYKRNDLSFRDYHYEDVWACVTRNFGKGFMLGAGGKLSINALFLLLGVLRGRTKRTNLSELLQREDLYNGVRRFGLFFGSLLSVNNTIMYLLGPWLSFKMQRGAVAAKQQASGRGTPDHGVSSLLRSPKWRRIMWVAQYYRGVFAGGAAGLCLAFLPKESRSGLILFSTVRSLEVACKLLARRFNLEFQHADTLLMMLASAQMVWSFIYKRATLDQSYVRFLQHHVQLPRPVVDAVKDMQTGRPLNIDKLNALRSKMKSAPQLITDPLIYDKHKNVGGFILHPQLPYLKFFFRFLARGIRRAIPVYLPVYIVPVLLFSLPKASKRPLEYLQRIILGVSRSSLFLGLYCAIGICSLSGLRSLGLRHAVIGKHAHIAPAVAGFLAGLSTLLEKKGRRIELALYVLSKGLESLYNIGHQANVFPLFQGSDVALFSASLAMLVHAFVRHPETLRSTYKSMLQRFFDSERRHRFIGGVARQPETEPTEK